MGLLSGINKTKPITEVVLQEMVCGILKLKDCYIEDKILYIQSNRSVIFNDKEIKSLLCKDGILSGHIKEIRINCPVFIHILHNYQFDPNIHIKIDKSICISAHGNGRYKIENINIACKAFWGDSIVDILSGKIACKSIHIPRGCIVDKTKITYVKC